MTALLVLRNKAIKPLLAAALTYESLVARNPAGPCGSAFLFHEGRDRTAAAAFKQIANLSHGAYLSFDLSSADRLKELLGAVAVYAAGGYRALAAYGEKKGGEVLRLTAQLRE